MTHAHRPVPQAIPGALITDLQHLHFLREHLGQLCGLPEGARRFPGSQPVSFEHSSLELLEQENFWVCEKSDGVRVLVFIVTPGDGMQEVYLIDRKDDFYQVGGFYFPHWLDPKNGLSNTLLDGELVIDVDRKTGQQTMRLLAFDLLVIGQDNIMKKSLLSRYGKLKAWVIEPYEKCLVDYPDMRLSQPFEIRAKPMELAYGLNKVFAHDLPRLEHGNDGLIFTSAEAPYTSGTDPKILKWKPPHENSIDFRLELRFPPAPSPSTTTTKSSKPRPLVPDYTAKPAFLLMMNNGGRKAEEFFDELYVSDSDWKTFKSAGVQLDDRVVECVWDKETQTWRALRFRDDKREGNFRDVVFSIVQSIQDGVEQETLIEHSPIIRQRWKAREAAHKEVEERYKQARQAKPSASSSSSTSMQLKR